LSGRLTPPITTIPAFLDTPAFAEVTTGRVLVAEDDATLRGCLEVLTGAGHRVTAVRTAPRHLRGSPQPALMWC
jgi:hypothetical protein